MSKLGSHHPFGHLKHKLWPKERLGVKLAIWLPTTKVGNRPNFLVCKGRATYHWRALNEGYNFSSDLISIGGLHTKLWGPKFTGVPTLAISRLPLGSPGTKSHLDVGLVEKHIIYYKGEGDGFPQVRAVVSFVNPSYSWFVLASKVLQLCINHLYVGFVQVRMSNWCLSLFLVPSRSSSTPLYPSKWCEPESMPRLFVLPLFSIWTHIWIH